MNSPLRMTSLPTKLVRHLQIGSGASDAGARVLVAVCVVYVCHVPCGGGVSGRESQSRKGKTRELAARNPFLPAPYSFPYGALFFVNVDSNKASIGVVGVPRCHKSTFTCTCSLLTRMAAA